MSSIIAANKAEEKERTAVDILMDAVERGDPAAVQHALRDGANVNCERRNSSRNRDTSPLIEACNRGFDVIVRMLLDAGANVWCTFGHGWSAMIEACYRGRLSIVEMLLTHDSDLLESKHNFGWTPLFYAVRNGHSEVVRFLMDRGANVNVIAGEVGTALHLACQVNKVEIARLLLAAGVDVEARGEEQATVLHDAVTYNRSDLVRELILQYNANIFAVDKDGYTPFDIASHKCPSDPYVDPFLQIYADKLTQDQDPLVLHVLLKAAEYSVREWHFLHPPSNPLQMQTPLGKLKLQHFHTILQHCGTDFIRNRDNSGKLLIHVACQTKAPVEVVAMLVDLDSATLQIPDDTGALPLHECCNGTVDYSSVRHLVEQGGVGTLAARNHQGALPLHLLCGSTNPSMRTVQYMIQSFPGSASMRTNAGFYPFMVAATSDSASLSVVYELFRANPGVLTPR